MIYGVVEVGDEYSDYDAAMAFAVLQQTAREEGVVFGPMRWEVAHHNELGKPVVHYYAEVVREI